ncbi:hypothetical protein [Pseudodonghicola flavimaris]|uniref:Uncharacterized protein n=1 Tax=Pseudodonghicola flavimaris TaxID=3050036 RepID=A0ABT7EZ51_9RHOB|nr:hypothetical protein [Pseudodonghicola flavimaris]MDK3017627.1 hypothetical protein [Pseudodonghicola flavimaris]
MLNQELGILVQFAFHDPKKMPDFTKAAPEVNEAEQRELQLAQLRSALVGMHFQSKKGK